MIAELERVYGRLKSFLPNPVREALGWINQTFFARRTLKRKYGEWFEVDWRKKFLDLSDSEWQNAYDEAWKNRTNDCLEETDADLILRSLGSTGSVLDVGCGAGALAVRLAGEGFRVTGLDVSAEALRLAKERSKAMGAAVDWKVGFAEHLPVPKKSVDYITCCHTLEHVRDLSAAVREFHRVARKRIVVLVPKQGFKMYMDNYHTQFFDTEEKLAAAMGFSDYTCKEIDCSDHRHEFKGKAFLFVGELPRP